MYQFRTKAIHSQTPEYQSALATFWVICASLLIGAVPYFAKNLADAGIAPTAIAFMRYSLTAIAMLPFLKLGRQYRSATLWGILAGAGLGLGWIGYVTAIRVVPISTVGVLYMTFPIFTFLISWAWFGRTPGVRTVVAAVIIVVAAIMSMSPAAAGKDALPFLLLALLTPLSFGVALNVLTEKLIVFPPLSRISCVTLGATLGLLPLVLRLDSEQMIPSEFSDWWLVVGLALGTALVPQILYTIYAPKIGAAKSSIAASMELPTMFVVAWLAFGETIGPVQLIAAALVVTAILITPARRAPAVTANTGASGK